MELYKKLKIDDIVYQNIVKKLKRKPNDFETHLFSAMHSEHCGYLHSKKYLNDFYTNNNFQNENAGCVQIKDHCIFFKIESHNHPCAIEPYQGSMTGIGGIIRDVLSLGAKPICLLNSLKFGRIKESKTKYYLSEVVRGISDYGNSTGIPVISGETIFNEQFENIPIVNVLAAGIVKADKIKFSSAKENSYIIILGSKTGVDGLGGATFASDVLSENSKRSSVQIGDPYLKKLLIEATLKINSLNSILACQDLGASGILSSTSELCYKGKCGAKLYLQNVHVQNENITPLEIMLSETQERMAFIVEKTGLEEFKKIADEFELEFSIIGETTEENRYSVFYKDKLLADIPLEALCEPYLYTLKSLNKKYEKNIKTYNIKDEFFEMINDENFCSKKYIYSQFDQEVQGRTAFSQKENSIGILYLKEISSFIAFCIETNIDVSAFDAAIHSFLNLYRKLVSFGFEPLGLTNCLNFSSPDDINVQSDFLETIEALKKLSKDFLIPVVSGNVSFYNETNNYKIPPCATFSMLGAIDDKNKVIKPNIYHNDKIFLLGDCNCVFPDFSYEINLKNIIFDLYEKKLIHSVKTIDKYGIIGTLLKNSLFYGIGFEISYKKDLYFKKNLPCYLLLSNHGDLTEELKKYNIPFQYLGKYLGDKIKFDDLVFDLDKINQIYQNKICFEMEK